MASSFIVELDCSLYRNRYLPAGPNPSDATENVDHGCGVAHRRPLYGAIRPPSLFEVSARFIEGGDVSRDEIDDGAPQRRCANMDSEQHRSVPLWRGMQHRRHNR
jgi:hypothetical protein